jgi:hypothetical protein
MRGSLLEINRLAAVAILGLTAVGCMCPRADRQIEFARRAEPAYLTIGDYEVGRAALFGELARAEGLRWLSPKNPEALLMLTRGWARAGFGFIEDDWEAALDAGEDELAEEQRTRARGAYTRAIFYGLEYLDLRAQDFQYARRSPAALRAWLKNFDAHSAAALFWTGHAWLARGAVSKDIPAIASDLEVGVAMLERVIELDDSFDGGMAHLALGSWYARSADADLEKARKHFDRAAQINKGKLLISQVLFARTYYCVKGDKVSYTRFLNDVVGAGDPMPEQRLINVVAQRRARRYLSDVRMADCGF